MNDLTTLFKDTFHYDVTEVNLMATRCQLQLQKELNDWAYKHDSKETLLIVYYAGHGIYDLSSKVLEYCP